MSQENRGFYLPLLSLVVVVGDLCGAAVGATDSPFFTDVEAPRDRLLPPPETSYAANTTRVQILEVVPYSSLFPGDEE